MNNPSEQYTDAQVRAIIQKAITNGATRYIQGCEARVDDFARRHYSFRGALKLHAHALGWDILRVPINIIWSVVNILFSLVGFIAQIVGLKQLRSWLNKIPPGLETDMDRQISWLVVTELQQLLEHKLAAFVAPSKQPDFESKLKAKLAEYGATRTGSAELTSNAALLITSKLAFGQVSFGTLGLGTAASTAVAHSIAVSNFWLGSTIGSYYYALVPVAVSLRLLIAVTALFALVLALVSTFIGIFTDPLQAALGIHQRRLRKLINAIGDDLQGQGNSSFELREKYAGRLFDVVDLLTTVGRTV